MSVLSKLLFGTKSLTGKPVDFRSDYAVEKNGNTQSMSVLSKLLFETKSLTGKPVDFRSSDGLKNGGVGAGNCFLGGS